MLTRDFDYRLPAERIAQHPAPRGSSRLLVLPHSAAPEHRRVGELPELLEPGDLLVVNDTRVLPARLFASTAGGGRVELLLVERLSERDWTALARPGRKARPGTELALEAPPERGRGAGEAGAGGPPAVTVVDSIRSGQYRIRFSAPIEPWLERLGHVPLPPYIHRPDRPEDRERYQTVYARRPGAIAAPTAGLHFDEALLERIRRRGVAVEPLTLHVGIGTFKPVRCELVHEHRMDAERYEIPEPTARAVERARRAGGRVVAVGTTVVRALESAASAAGEVAPGPGSTELFIVPGHAFRVVDRLLTNFHLPRSTLLMLVAAFAGRERVLAAYEEAVARGYRFYSYGDAMLLDRH